MARTKVKDEEPTVPIKMLLDVEPGLFYEVGDAHLTFFREEKATTFWLGPKIPLACMFEAHWIVLDGERVGLHFVTQFQVTNGGGYLLGYLNKGKASKVEVLLKSKNIVIYSFPNRGALIIACKIGPDVLTIFEEQ